jgi:hypothetical protein
LLQKETRGPALTDVNYAYFWLFVKTY